MSIKSKLLYTFLLLSIVPMAFVAITSFINTSQEMKEAELRDLFHIADLKVQNITHYFEERRSDMLAAQAFYIIKANLPVLIQNFNTPNDPAFQKSLQALDRQLIPFQEAYDYIDVMLTDPDGRIMYATSQIHRAMELGKPLPNLNSESLSQAKQEITFSDVFEYAGKKEILTLGAAYNLNGNAIGLIAFEEDMEHIDQFIQDTTGLGATGETLIGVRTENEALFINKLRHDPTSALKRKVELGNKDAIPIQEAVQGINGSGISVDYRGKEILAVWRHIPLLNWGLVAKIDVSEAYGPLYKLGLIKGIIGLFTLLVVAVLAIFFAKSITNPIDKLRQGAQAIGEGHLDYRIGLTGKDEISQFANTFDRMVDNLKKVTTSRDELDKEIHERRELEDKLLKLNLAIEQSTSAIIITDDDAVIEFINPHVISETGFTREETIGNKPNIWKSGKHTEKFYKGLWSTLKSGDTWEGEFINKRKNGDIFYWSSSVSPIRDSEEKITHYVQVATNITERKKMEEDLKRSKEVAERASQAKSDFLANMSHELRTPLNSIIGFSEVLEDETFGPMNEKQKDYASDIVGSGKHLLSLINDILDLSKIEAGKMELLLSNFDLKNLLEESLVLVKEKAMKHGFNISTDIADDVGNVEADQRKIKQIIYNLLSNATKFTPDGGEIGIRASKKDDHFEISVWDSGIGISDEERKKVFEEFTQLENIYSKEQQGTGLGLSLVKNMVELHGGKINVASEGKGKGTTFTFTIPLKIKKET